MKKLFIYIIAALSVFAFVSCEIEDIPTYDVEDSAVLFQRRSEQFSLRGQNDDYALLTIKLDLFGPAADYDRAINVEVVDSTYNNAVYGVDFEIEQAYVPAGELAGKIILKVKKVSIEDPTKITTLAIRTNDFFKYVGSQANVSRISWSDEYLRPSNQYAWQSWFYFFGSCYSKNYHRLLVEVLGDEIEHSGYSTGARSDPDTDYRVLTWWYAKANQFYEFVKKHDAEHPDDPYMHSDDFESYTSYLTPVGSGMTQTPPPTILSTINHN